MPDLIVLAAATPIDNAEKLMSRGTLHSRKVGGGHPHIHKSHKGVSSKEDPSASPLAEDEVCHPDGH